MRKNSFKNFDFELILNRSNVRKSETPLFEQIYENIRQAILSRRLRVGTKIPSTRLLAKELKVSRNTVLNAFEQLFAEGYLITKKGSGTYVAEKLPDDLLQARNESFDSKPHQKTLRKISERGKKLAKTKVAFSANDKKPRAFQTGFTAHDKFPMNIWTRIITRNLRKSSGKLQEYLDYREIHGYFPLREAISKYLASSRGVVCEPEQIIIVSGSQQGLDLAARVLLDKGDEVLIEDPNYKGALGALLAAEAKIIPVPLDAEGIDLAAAQRISKNSRAAFVTPSHHFPLGTVMSLSRRLELLEWANRNGTWIVEDDYDSEFRYDGKPFPALYGLDGNDRVIYSGTFSKVMFPSLRLGYLVVPPDLVNAFAKALLFTTVHAPVLEQVALTDFINEGHFGRHIRRMRKLYAERQDLLVNEIQDKLSDFLEVEKDNAGMSLVAWLKKDVRDVKVAEVALRKGVYISPLSLYCLNEKLPNGLVLGYTGFSKKEVREGIKRLQIAFQD